MKAGVTLSQAKELPEVEEPSEDAWPCPDLSSVLHNFSNFLVRIPFEVIITTALGNFCKMIFEANRKSIFSSRPECLTSTSVYRSHLSLIMVRFYFRKLHKNPVPNTSRGSSELCM